MDPENKTINRRLRIRRACDSIEVYLRSQLITGDRLVKMSVKDISNKGAFLRCNPAKFSKDMLLYLVFSLQMGSVVKLHRVHATIARVAADGIGVRFMTKVNT